MEQINLENVRLLENRVLVKLDTSQRVTRSGLLIAEAPMTDGHNKIYPQVGEVILISPTVTDVKVGDKVICTKYNGVFVQGLPKDIKVLYEHYIEAIVDKDISLVVEWGKKW